jgi:uroporphyrinogen decarboxylase
VAPDKALQGNLDPALCVAGWEVAAAGARDVLARNAGHPGHVFNLGHGVLPETDPSVLERLVELVHTEGSVDPAAAPAPPATPVPSASEGR